jgi:hypothetical protein
MPETKILGPPTLPPPERLTEGRETQDLAGGEGGEESWPPDSPLFTVEEKRGERRADGSAESVTSFVGKLLSHMDR